MRLLAGRSLSFAAVLVAVLVAALCGTLSCRRESSPEPAPPVPVPPSDPEVVAVYAGGSFTAGDVDRAVLAIPAQQGRLAEEKTAQWYRELIRRSVAERILLEEAKLIGTGEDPELLAVHQETRRQVVMEAYLASNRPLPEPITESDLRRYFEQHRDDYAQADRRLVRHIFRRREDSTSSSRLRQEVAELRQRVHGGESFGRLAKEHSDSESRHNDGLLGWVAPGAFPPVLDEVIFSLEEGLPSEPLPTAEGFHLFLVEKAVKAKQYSLDEVKTLIGRKLEAERGDRAVARLVADMPLPEGSFVAEPDELRSLLRAGDGRAVVLGAGDYELRLGRFRTLLAERRAAAGAQVPPDLALQLLEYLERRERIYRHAAAQGLAEDPKVTARLAELAERELAGFYGRRVLERKLSRESERLRQHYRNNKLRYSSPLRLRLRRLTLPLDAGDANANAAMARLEQARSELDDGTLELAAVASELGGRIEEPEWLTLREMAKLGPPAVRLAVDLKAGEHSPPYQTATSLELLEVLERREPEPLPLASVLDQVRAAYLEDHRQELYREWLEETLAEAGLVIYQDRLEALAARSLPLPAAAGSETTKSESGS